jgi:predicted anti-sigma-YlaC factor YlaD
MRCRDARIWLTDQRRDSRDSEEVLQNSHLLLEHLAGCPECRTYQRQQQQVARLLQQSALTLSCRVSTERIMEAIYQRQRSTRQLEELRSQQRSRLARLQPLGSSLMVMLLLLTGGLPLLLFFVFFHQPELLVQALLLLGDVLDAFLVATEYLRMGLSIVSQDNLLLAAIAFLLIVLAGMWLRLMRVPQEA